MLNAQGRILVFAALCTTAALTAACSGGQAREAKYMAKGKDFLAAGNFEKARVEFRNALQIAPNDAEARFQNGVVDEKLGNRREAAQFYQNAIDANPSDVRARIALSRLYVVSGGAAQALDIIKPAFTAHPNDVGLLTVRAAAEARLHQDTAALADGEHAVQLDPTSEDAVGVLASLYEHGQQTDKASALLESTIVKVPSSVELRLLLAQLYLIHSEPAKTESLLVDLVRLRPTEPAHRLRLAQFYATHQRGPEAEQVLRDGVKALPADRNLKIALVELLAMNGKRDVAEKELQGFIAGTPKDVSLRFALAAFYEQSKELPKAESVYHEVIDSYGTDAPGLTARDHLAALRSQQNDIVGAGKLIGEVLDKSPRDSAALQLRAQLYMARNDPTSAIGDLRSVLRDDPNALGVMRQLARAYLANAEPALAEETLRRAVDSNPKDGPLRLELAQTLLQAGKTDQAKGEIDEVLKAQPSNPDALEAQFKAALVAKDTQGAKAAADKLMVDNPKLPVAYFNEGVLEELAQHLDDASRLYATALEMQPNATEVLQGLVRVLVRQNRIPDALKRLDDAATRFPQSAFPLNLRGEVLISQKRNDEAIAAFKSAIQREPKAWVGYRNLAIAQSQANDANDAIATLRGGIEATVIREPLELELADIYARQGDSSQAEQVYEQALKRDANSNAVANNLAMLLVNTRSDKASLQRAKDLTARFSGSGNAQFLDTYGWVLYKSGNANAAVTALQSATFKAPQLPELWYHLGMAQKLAGQSDAARESLTKSLQAGRSFNGIGEAKSTLDTLSKHS